MMLRVLVLSCMAVWPAFVFAGTVGSVVLSLGENTAKQPKEAVRKLKRKSDIFERDQIETGQKGRLQLKFSDGSRLSLRPLTAFTVEEYRFSQEQPQKGHSFYRLLRGGMRTITGAISSADPDHYEVRTPIATIGVRGTHYDLFYCDLSCSQRGQGEQGLHGYVLEGAVVVKQDERITEVAAGEFFFIGGKRISVSKAPLTKYQGRLNLHSVPLVQPAVPALNIQQSSPSQGQRTPQTGSPAPNNNLNIYPGLNNPIQSRPDGDNLRR